MIINNINVHIKVKNFVKSYKFYKSLGFEEVFAYGPDKEVKEVYNGATFKHGGAMLEIADGHRGVKPAVFQESITSSKMSLFIEVSSISEMYKRCVDLGIEIAVGVRHYYWGKLEFVIRDPDGVILVFFAPYTQEEAAKLDVDTTFSVMPTQE